MGSLRLTASTRRRPIKGHGRYSPPCPFVTVPVRAAPQLNSPEDGVFSVGAGGEAPARHFDREPRVLGEVCEVWDSRDCTWKGVLRAQAHSRRSRSARALQKTEGRAHQLEGDRHRAHGSQRASHGPWSQDWEATEARQGRWEAQGGQASWQAALWRAFAQAVRAAADRWLAYVGY